MKNKIKKNIFWIILIISIAIIIILAYLLFKKNKEVQLVNTNLYNSNFYELVDYIQNVETYLSKSTISTSSTHSAETLTYLWREANLAQTYLSELPIQSQELENTLNELALELENGALSWKDLTKKDNGQFAQSVSSSLDIFDQLEQNFHEYSGLIYDGAFSEHLTSSNPKMIKGDEISEEDAAKKAKDFLGENNVSEISNLGANENANILAYNFSIKNNDGKTTYISISKKGGYVIYSSFNREIKEQKLNYEEANNKALEYLKQKGFDNMKETYYLAENGILTINYAYVQQDIIMYPDLIKIKVALDNGEILGIETTGYLSNHEERNLKTAKITKEEAKKKLNKNLNIMSEKMAVIPTEYKTEIFCYEFKGKIDDREFIVYINAETGEEEDILVIYNTPNGVLTM